MGGTGETGGDYLHINLRQSIGGVLDDAGEEFIANGDGATTIFLIEVGVHS
jgi:hypothetical protein